MFSIIQNEDKALTFFLSPACGQARPTIASILPRFVSKFKEFCVVLCGLGGEKN